MNSKTKALLNRIETSTENLKKLMEDNNSTNKGAHKRSTEQRTDEYSESGSGKKNKVR